MKKSLLILAAAALLIAGIILRHPSTANQPRASQVRPAPDFSLTDLSGQKLALSGYRSKVVLLDFWATWCDPCKAEIPHFIEMQNRYGPKGLQVIGISMDDDEQLARDFRQQFKMSYPVAMGSPALAEQYGGILGLPITFTIDRQGRIFSKHIGATDPSIFEAEIKKLLATP
jgi:thiol-disulfide isomerase/thioredoxin